MAFRPVPVLVAVSAVLTLSTSAHSEKLDAETTKIVTKLGKVSGELWTAKSNLKDDRLKPATKENRRLVHLDAIRVSVLNSLFDEYSTKILHAVSGNAELERQAVSAMTDAMIESTEMAVASQPIPADMPLDQQLVEFEVRRTDATLAIEAARKKHPSKAVGPDSKWLAAEIAQDDARIYAIRLAEYEEELKRLGPPPNVYLGIAFEPLKMLTPSDRRSIDVSLTGNDGAIVTQVYPAGPAQSAGMKQFDVILSIDHKKIGGEDNFHALLTKHKAGDKLALDVFRDNRHVPVTVVLLPRPKDYGIPKPE